MGVAINQPNAIVEAETSQRFIVQGEKSELVKQWVELFLKKYDLKPEVAVNVKQAIPQHVGLGSGTQLALAAATALAKLFNTKASTLELSKAMGRGAVSGVGTALFEKGGFVLEGGVKSQKNKPLSSWDGFPPVIFQSSFPDNWFFAVAIPQVKGGLSGEAEAHAFKDLPPMSSGAGWANKPIDFDVPSASVKRERHQDLRRGVDSDSKLGRRLLCISAGRKVFQFPVKRMHQIHAEPRSFGGGSKFMGTNCVRAC